MMVMHSQFPSQQPRDRAALTVVELLVTIAVIPA